jgi:hypothetical protein
MSSRFDRWGWGRTSIAFSGFAVEAFSDSTQIFVCRFLDRLLRFLPRFYSVFALCLSPPYHSAFADPNPDVDFPTTFACLKR